MPAYYNEFDPYAAEWLRNLIDAGHIAPGDVDERSITEVMPSDLEGYDQCHFFAGIGGWPLALRLAGWADDAPVFSGSCPCQPFSAAGKGKGTDDERHLWPEFHRLIEACHPPFVFGEQVASAEVVGTQLEADFAIAVQGGDYAKANKLAKRLARTKSFSWTPRWVDGISADLEASGYTFRFDVLGAHSVGAPHIRQRLFWVADSKSRGGCGRRQVAQWRHTQSRRPGSDCRLGDSIGPRPQGFAGDGDHGHESGRERTDAAGPAATTGDAPDGVADSEDTGGQPDAPATSRVQGEAWEPQHNQPAGSRQSDVWRDCHIIPCRDGKARRVGSSVQPLAYGLPRNVGRMLAGVEGVDAAAIRLARRNRNGRLKGYGNAICPQLAAEFVAAAMAEQWG